ncbi:MAG: hypothetical protein K2P14_10395 [Anaeroplasmataceae bacterium]|nr:hypothetical protein [Anaeroplasmataceae bacterium]
MEEKPLTVKDLLKCCQIAIENGYEDCSIMISDDNEGNGYHYLWYSFTNAEELEVDNIDKEIAPIEKTIILG